MWQLGSYPALKKVRNPSSIFDANSVFSLFQTIFFCISVCGFPSFSALMIFSKILLNGSKSLLSVFAITTSENSIDEILSFNRFSLISA